MTDNDFVESKDNQASIVTLDAALRTDLPAFVRKVFGTVSPGSRYAANWHIEAICHELEKVRRGENKRLIITMPPRHLKSICASVAFSAWMLGHDPTRQIICVSYAQELATKHGNDCRAVMSSEWYQRLFPGAKIDEGKNTETEFMPPADSGTYRNKAAQAWWGVARNNLSSCWIFQPKASHRAGRLLP
jgi:hypothetical protein